MALKEKKNILRRAVSSDAVSIFTTSDPTPKEEFTHGACELPCTQQGDDSKPIKKHKDVLCRAQSQL